MNRVRAFVEAPAGLASVSLRLHGGPHCRPPISRLGAKTGYAEAILGLAGLRSGQSAGAFVWAEADADVRGLLRAYPDAAMLRRVADIIRGWADEEPRALWERLRAERKARGPVADDAGVAGWIVTGGWAMRRGEPESGYTESRTDSGIGEGHGDGAEAMARRCTTLAEYAQLAASNRLIPGCADPRTGEWINAARGGATFGGADFATPAQETAEGFERLAANVAAGMMLGHCSFRRGDVESGYRPDAAGMPASDSFGALSPWHVELGSGLARVPASGWPPVAVLPSIPTAAELSAMLGTPGDLDGVVYYADPPYRNTTGYAASLPREAVVRAALDAAAMGALVMVSEAVAVEELVAHGWHAVDIGHTRRGQKRTFARVATEVVTMSRAPVHVHGRQVGLFAGAA